MIAPIPCSQCGSDHAARPGHAHAYSHCIDHAPAIHTCSCGRLYGRATWRELPLSYVRRDDDGTAYEARNCPCGSTREVSLEHYREERDADDRPVRCEHCDRMTRVTYETVLGDYGPGLYCSTECALVCGDCGKSPGVRQARDEHDGWLLCRECEQKRAVEVESVLNSDNDPRAAE